MSIKLKLTLIFKLNSQKYMRFLTIKTNCFIYIKFYTYVLHIYKVFIKYFFSKRKGDHRIFLNLEDKLS